MFLPKDAAAEDVPLIKRVARWLDWWCTPRWRALLTWVVLALVMEGAVMWLRLDTRVFGLLTWTLTRIQNLTGVPLPPLIDSFITNANGLALYHWFEPFLLRCSLVRGLAWLAARIGSMALCNVCEGNLDILGIVLILVLPTLVLWGWRTRPWMAVVGSMVMASMIFMQNRDVLIVAAPYWGPMTAIPFAAALLYGTRLLQPEKRAGNST